MFAFTLLVLSFFFIWTIPFLLLLHLTLNFILFSAVDSGGRAIHKKIQLISCNARAKLYSDKAKSKSNLLSLGLQLPSGHCMASLSLSKLEQLRLHQRRQWSLRFCWTPYLFAANGTVLGSYTRSNWSKSCHESS
ncbi:uncharacterized protein [Malus domestica]|uniref:uncharacterized protein isoform X1 n=1 Tax=Malus domestica TaxID=3750 RepID=UPI0039769EDE